MNDSGLSDPGAPLNHPLPSLTHSVHATLDTAPVRPGRELGSTTLDLSNIPVSRICPFHPRRLPEQPRSGPAPLAPDLGISRRVRQVPTVAATASAPLLPSRAPSRPRSDLHHVPGPSISPLTGYLPFHLSRRPRPGTCSFQPGPFESGGARTPAPLARAPRRPGSRLLQASAPGPAALPDRPAGSAPAATHPGAHRCERAASPSPASAQPTPQPLGGVALRRAKAPLWPMSVSEPFRAARASGQWGVSPSAPPSKCG